MILLGYYGFDFLHIINSLLKEFYDSIKLKLRKPARESCVPIYPEILHIAEVVRRKHNFRKRQHKRLYDQMVKYVAQWPNL